MAKPNFGFQKRQKELEKKRKKEEKVLRKQERATSAVEGENGDAGTEDGEIEVA